MSAAKQQQTQTGMSNEKQRLFFFCFFFFLSSKLTVTLRCCKTEVKKNKEAVQKAKLPTARYINMVSFCWELWQGIQPNTALTRKDSTDFNSPRGETLAEHLSNLEYITPWNKIHIRQCEESLPYTKHKTLHFKTYVFTLLFLCKKKP